MNRKDADTARRLGPSAWRDDWMTATKETLMDTPEPTNQAMAAVSRAFDAGAEVYISGGTTRIEFTEDVFERWFTAEVAAARASQDATATNGPGDDAGAARGPHGAAAGHTEPRMRPEDVPDDIWQIARHAFADIGPGPDGSVRITTERNPWTALRDALAAVIPAIRVAVLDQARTELTTTRDGITWDDDIADSARAAYSDAINRLAALARGDQ